MIGFNRQQNQNMLHLKKSDLLSFLHRSLFLYILKSSKPTAVSLRVVFVADYLCSSLTVGFLKTVITIWVHLHSDFLFNVMLTWRGAQLWTFFIGPCPHRIWKRVMALHSYQPSRAGLTGIHIRLLFTVPCQDTALFWTSGKATSSLLKSNVGRDSGFYKVAGDFIPCRIRTCDLSWNIARDHRLWFRFVEGSFSTGIFQELFQS